MTDISKVLKLSIDKQKQMLEDENYDDFIKEVIAHKGCGDTKIPRDKFVVLSNNEEFWVCLSQLNCTTYHVEKHTAEDEVYKMIKLNILSTKPTNKEHKHG
jgi:hypothetical protein